MSQQRLIADLNLYHGLAVAAISDAGDGRRQHIENAGGGRRFKRDADIAGVNLYTQWRADLGIDRRQAE